MTAQNVPVYQFCTRFIMTKLHGPVLKHLQSVFELAHEVDGQRLGYLEEHKWRVSLFLLQYLTSFYK